MPIYEYVCRRCRHEFEVLVRGSEQPKCPHCGDPRLDKLLSVPAAPVTNSSGPQCAMDGCPARGSSGACGMGGCGMGDCGM
jgi:putative FmdB family regulatory protein